MPGSELAAAREKFLTADSLDPDHVRAAILASWSRSRQWNVAADRIRLDHVRNLDVDTPLTHSALPILRNLCEHLDGQPISIILTDPAGVVLTRMVADQDLQRHLDRVQLAVGFRYAEECVGTNGIGTALEGGRPMYVFGHEHYAENLEDLACAAVPIHHPISGKTVGAIDLTCWRRDAGPLLVSLARTTADQIRHALLIDGGIREVELLQDYLRACRRNTGIVFAFNSDTVMSNGYARQALDPQDQSVLLSHALEALTGTHRGPVVVHLPSGITARMYCRPVRAGDPSAGGVVHLTVLHEEVGTTVALAPPSRVLLPGLVGTGALWLRSTALVETAFEAGEWMALTGEPGTGKLALARAVYQRGRPGARLRILDAADPHWLPTARQEFADPDTAVVIRHLDQLTARQVATLSTALTEVRADGAPAPWIAVTMGRRPENREFADLLAHFPASVEVPPLRHHIRDLADLVPLLLARLGTQDRPTCSPEAMALLMRSSWPGNVEQLLQALKRAVSRRQSGPIQPDDLPPECRTVSRRVLSPLESMERDAIVQGLFDAMGNKAKAAKALGMSRATIYRKVHEYGIISPRS